MAAALQAQVVPVVHPCHPRPPTLTRPPIQACCCCSCVFVCTLVCAPPPPAPYPPSRSLLFYPLSLFHWCASRGGHDAQTHFPSLCTHARHSCTPTPTCFLLSAPCIRVPTTVPGTGRAWEETLKKYMYIDVSTGDRVVPNPCLLQFALLVLLEAAPATQYSQSSPGEGVVSTSPGSSTPASAAALSSKTRALCVGNRIWYNGRGHRCVVL